MYTHNITRRIFYNIYYITYIFICTHFNFLIYGISMEIVIFLQLCTYKFRKCLSNSIHIYFIYIMQ